MRISKTTIRQTALALGAALFAFSPLHSAELTDTIALPEGTIHGTLPNGFQYIIRQNDYPANRAEFRLIWKVGSVQQNDDQGGAAHFLEHIAFGGTDNFPDRAAVSYLESLGMRYGIDINAFTGHDRTIYLFATPTTDELKADGFAKPLSIIRDWTENLTINPARVETEKGIILEELRSTVQEDPFYDLKIGQSRFASRMPLGTADEVSRMTASTLEEYYRKWYRPQLGAVVVVGDVEPAALERRIIEMFSSLRPGNVSDYQQYDLTYNTRRQIMIDVDSLTTNDDVEMIIPHPGLTVATLADARKKEMGKILVSALSRRFSDLKLRCDVSDAWYLGNTNHLAFTAVADCNMSLDSCVTRLANEIHSALRHGFDPNEIKVLTDSRASYLRRLAARENSSTGWCDDFADLIISGDRYISDPDQVETLIKAVESITPAEVSELLNKWMINYDQCMLIALRTSPRKADSSRLENFIAWWDKGLAEPTYPYVYTGVVKQTEEKAETPAILAAAHPYDPASITASRVYAGLGLHEYSLSNGIRLLVKPTDDPGTVLMSSVSPGGYGSIDPKKLPLLGGAASYIDMGGIAKADHIGDYLYQSGIALTTALENDWHGFLGACTPFNTNEFFNYVYEKITDPQLLYDEFEEIRADMLNEGERESVLSRMLSRASDRQLMIRMDELMCNTLNSEAAYEGVADKEKARRDFITQMSLDSMAGFYKELFGRTEGTTYLLCGDLQPDSVARQFASVFGRMARSSAPNYSRSTTLSLPTDTLTQRFNNENPTQTAFDYLFFGSYEPGLRNSLVLKMMTNVLRHHTIAELRERLALVYSPYVALQYEGYPRKYFYFDINSSAENDNMARVHRALMDVIADLRVNPVPASELDAIKQSCIVARREALSDDATAMWRTTLTGLIKNGEEFGDFENYEQIIRSITPEDVRDAFKSHINPSLFALLYMSANDVKLN